MFEVTQALHSQLSQDIPSVSRNLPAPSAPSGIRFEDSAKRGIEEEEVDPAWPPPQEDLCHPQAPHQASSMPWIYMVPVHSFHALLTTNQALRS
jgi:hypothetical protein